MTALPEPQFIDRNPEAIRNEIVARVEGLLGEALPPMSTERMLCEQLAYRETLVRIAVQEACLQNLWAYARFPMIDYLAALLNQSRREAEPATTTLQFTLPAARGVVSVIPRDSVVRSKDGKVTFTTDADVTIAAGETTGTTGGTCTVAGTAGNGYITGQLIELVTRPGFTVSVTNTTTSSEGKASETTEELRARVPSVASLISGAGPGDAYENLAKAASVDVLDAKATRPGDGVVTVTVLATYGVPSSGLLGVVSEALTTELKVPLTDTVQVSAATGVDVALELSVTLYYPQSPRTTDQVLEDVEAVATAWVESRGRKLGYQLPAGSLVQAIKTIAEVFDVTVTGGLPTIGELEYAALSSVTVTMAGYTTEPLP